MGIVIGYGHDPLVIDSTSISSVGRSIDIDTSQVKFELELEFEFGFSSAMISEWVQSSVWSLHTPFFSPPPPFVILDFPCDSSFLWPRSYFRFMHSFIHSCSEINQRSFNFLLSLIFCHVYSFSCLFFLSSY